jgi:hypothetical protein
MTKKAAPDEGKKGLFLTLKKTTNTPLTLAVIQLLYF